MPGTFGLTGGLKRKKGRKKEGKKEKEKKIRKKKNEESLKSACQQAWKKRFSKIDFANSNRHFFLLFAVL